MKNEFLRWYSRERISRIKESIHRGGSAEGTGQVGANNLQPKTA